MDLSYATILVFGMQRRLYRENRLAYMIRNRDNPKNHPICSIDTNMDSSMLFNEVGPQKDELGPSDSGSSESDYQSAEVDMEDGPNGVSSTTESNDG